MGKTGRNINILRYYRGRIYYLVSGDGGYLTIFVTDKRKWCCNWYQRTYHEITVKSFWKDHQTLQNNLRATTLVVAPQILPCKKHTAVKYHHFWIFVPKGDIEVEHIDPKEQTMDIFTKYLYHNFFYNFISSLTVVAKMVYFFTRYYENTRAEQVP